MLVHCKHCVKSVRIRSYSGLHFPAFGLNTERYEVSLCIQSECGKMRTRITPNTDNFHAVKMIFFCSNCRISESVLVIQDDSHNFIISKKPKVVTYLNTFSIFEYPDIGKKYKCHLRRNRKQFLVMKATCLDIREKSNF